MKRYLITILAGLLLGLPAAHATFVNEDIDGANRVSNLGGRYFQMYFHASDGYDYPVYVSGGSPYCSGDVEATPTVLYFSVKDSIRHTYYVQCNVGGTTYYFKHYMNKETMATSKAATSDIQVYVSLYNPEYYWVGSLQNEPQNNMSSQGLIAMANGSKLNYNSRAWDFTADTGIMSMQYGGPTEWNSEVKLVEVFPFEITYTYKYEGEVVKTEKYMVLEGDDLPATSGVPYGFTCDAPEGTADPEVTNYDITVVQEEAFPFDFCTSLEDGIWYTWSMRSGFAHFNGTNYPEGAYEGIPEGAAYQFAFVGNPFSFKILTCTGQFMSSTGANNSLLLPDSVGSDFTCVATDADEHTYGDFYFRLAHNSGAFVNDIQHFIGIWANDAAKVDVGSQVTLTENEGMRVYPIEFVDAPEGAGIEFDGTEILPTDTVLAIAAFKEVKTSDITPYEVTNYEVSVKLEEHRFIVQYVSNDYNLQVQEELDAFVPFFEESVGVGYPGQTVRAQVQAVIDAAQKAVDEGTSTAETLRSVRGLKEPFIACRDIQQPEDGKLYYFVNHHVTAADDLTLDGVKLLLAAGSETELVCPEYDESNIPVEGIYLAHRVDSIHYAFRNFNGSFLTRGGNSANAEKPALNPVYSEVPGQQSSVLHLAHTEKSQFVAPEEKDYFGFVEIRGYRNTSNLDAPLIIASDGTFDNVTGSFIRWNNDTKHFSTAFRCVEADPDQEEYYVYHVKFDANCPKVSYVAWNNVVVNKTDGCKSFFADEELSFTDLILPEIEGCDFSADIEDDSIFVHFEGEVEGPKPFLAKQRLSEFPVKLNRTESDSVMSHENITIAFDYTANGAEEMALLAACDPTADSQTEMGNLISLDVIDKQLRYRIAQGSYYFSRGSIKANARNKVVFVFNAETQNLDMYVGAEDAEGNVTYTSYNLALGSDYFYSPAHLAGNENAYVYLGAAVANGSKLLQLDGQIHSVQFFDGAMTASQVATIQYPQISQFSELQYSTAGDEHWYYVTSVSTTAELKGLVMNYDAANNLMKVGPREFNANKVWSFWKEGGKATIKNYAGNYVGTAGTGTGTATKFGKSDTPNYIYSVNEFSEGNFTISDGTDALCAVNSGSLIIRAAAEEGNGAMWNFEEVDITDAATHITKASVVQGRVTTGIGNKNLPIARSTITVEGLTGAGNFTSVKGKVIADNLADVAAVKAYFATNNRELFVADGTPWRESNAELFATGTVDGEGNFVITGNKSLEPGTYYLWITFDIAETATEGNTVDANITQYTMGGINTEEEFGNPTYAATIFLSEGTVLMPGDKGSTYYRIPAITTTADGQRLVVLTDDRKQSNGDLPNHVYVVAQYSDDMGKTWSEPVTVAGTANLGGDYGHGDASLVTNRINGDIVGIMTSAGTYGKGFFSSTAEEPLRWKTIVSHDNGVTWEAPVDHTDALYGAACNNAATNTWKGGFSGSGAALQKRDGTLVSPFVNRSANNSQNCFLFMSKDGGKNWYVSGNSGTTSCDEPKVLERNNGDLAISVRQSGYNITNYTTNDGETWEKAPATRFDTGITGNACDGEYMVWASTLDGNEENVAFQTKPYNTQRQNLSIALSYGDEGESFDPSIRTICPVGSGYSATTVLPDGTLGVYYEEQGVFGGYTMRFVRFSLDWASFGEHSFNRNFKPVQSEATVTTQTSYATVVLPFDAPAPGDATVFYLGDVTEKDISGTIYTCINVSMATSLEAFRPYLLIGASESYTFTRSDWQAYRMPADCVAKNGNAIGAFVNKRLSGTAGNLFTFGLQESLIGFQKIGASKTATVNAYNAYVQADKDADFIRINNDPTCITNVDANADADVIYDLSGRRVETVTNGIYVINGQKVFLQKK